MPAWRSALRRGMELGGTMARKTRHSNILRRPMTPTQRRIGPFSTPAIGLGAMNLSHGYGPAVPDAAAERLLLEALDLGVTHFDTAALYGWGANETLVGRVLKPHRSRIVLASKGGMVGEAAAGGIQRIIDGRPAAIRRHCEDSLRRLQTDTIDLYTLHRWDRRVPIEDTVGAMADLQRAGKVRALGLSEVSAATLRRAHAVAPIAAVQSEYSLWTRNPEIAVLDACRELGTAFVAFSPLGRAALTGTLRDVGGLDGGDIRRTMPRFGADAYASNLGVLDAFAALAGAAGITPAQFALAWVLGRGDHVLAIPGTTNAVHLRENVAADAVTLSQALRSQAEALFAPGRIVGGRYSAASQGEVDTEQFAPG
jgi:aryl-alcohol dehydrogenase-like predicted oxidoreductase